MRLLKKRDLPWKRKEKSMEAIDEWISAAQTFYDDARE